MKIQYPLSELQRRLGLGTIRDIHVAEVAGEKVLRIECDERDEWETVTRGGPAKKAQAEKRKPEKKKSGGLLGNAMDKIGIGGNLEKMLFDR